MIKFNNRVAEIDLATLKRTVSIQDAYGRMPERRPVMHYDVIERIAEETQKEHGTAVYPDVIYVPEKHTRRVKWDGNPEDCPVENYLIDGLATRILIGTSLNGHHPAIGISYSPSGITVGFGMNIKVCANQMIFGGTIWSTYGAKAIPYDKGMAVLSHWISCMAEMCETYDTRIAAMRERMISTEELKMFISDLFTGAVRRNKGDRHVFAPLNVTQVIRFTENILSLSNITVFDLSQAATYLMKPPISGSVELLEINDQFNTFIIDKFVK